MLAKAGALSGSGTRTMYAYLLSHFDLPILHVINGFCGQSWIRDRLVSHLALNFKWAIPLCIWWVLWFRPSDDQLARRRILLVIIVSVLASLVINRAISVAMPYRVRPMETPDIGYHAPLFESGFRYPDFEAWSSFPSDQTTYFFAFAAGFWLLSTRLGIVMIAYSTLIAVSRVYLGTHFPSDVTAGALLGVAVALALNRDYARRAVTPLLAFEKSKPAYFNGLMFFILLEMGTGFMNVRDIGRSVLHLVHGS
jgi:membrane-associated phospholipid phosphatase